MSEHDRAIAAIQEPMVVESTAPGMVRVCTVTDAYDVDVREGRCTCPDHQFREVRCKHIIRAEIETEQAVVPPIGGLEERLDERDRPGPHAPDGSSMEVGHV